MMYFCDVKRWLYILTFLFGLMLFSIGAQSDTSSDSSAVAGQLVSEQNTNQSERQVEVLSNDLRQSSCILPRRTVETSSNNYEGRSQRLVVRTVQFFHLKEAHIVLKTNLDKAFDISTEFSSLYFRTAHQIYAMRKIVV